MTTLLTFRPLKRDDLKLIHNWFQEPTINRWYANNQSWSMRDIEEKYLPRIERKDSVSSFIIYLHQKPIGFIQYYCLTHHLPEGIEKNNRLFVKHPPEQLAGLDLLIADADFRSKGWGQKILYAFIANHLTHYKAVVVDPFINNQQAISCYQKTGFISTDYSENSQYLIMVKQLSDKGQML